MWESGKTLFKSRTLFGRMTEAEGGDTSFTSFRYFSTSFASTRRTHYPKACVHSSWTITSIRAITIRCCVIVVTLGCCCWWWWRWLCCCGLFYFWFLESSKHMVLGHHMCGYHIVFLQHYIIMFSLLKWLTIDRRSPIYIWFEWAQIWLMCFDDITFNIIVHHAST